MIRLHFQKLLFRFPLLLVALLPIGMAHADFGKVCAPSIAKYCGDVEPGNGKLTSCMVRNQVSLPPVCRTAVYTTVEQGSKFSLVCASDLTPACSTLKPGNGRLYACLRFREEQLTPGCRNYLSKGE